MAFLITRNHKKAREHEHRFNLSEMWNAWSIQRRQALDLPVLRNVLVLARLARAVGAAMTAPTCCGREMTLYQLAGVWYYLCIHCGHRIAANISARKAPRR